MSFIIDNQTLDDLNILGKYKSNSIFSLFCHTETYGGEKMLEKMFSNLLTDSTQINRRAAIFTLFKDNDILFPFNKEEIKKVEHYLSTPAQKSKFIGLLSTCRRKFINYIAKDEEYELICDGIGLTIKLLNELNSFIKVVKRLNNANVLDELIANVSKHLESNDFRCFIGMDMVKYKTLTVFSYDYIFRAKCYEMMSELMEVIYLIDIYSSVANVAHKYNFTQAIAHEQTQEQNYIRAEQLYHPQLKNAISNSISVDSDQNVIFLTGANMAGKSTFMKSFGIAVYLAHMGFPVAAKSMEFTVKEGLYTSINVSDNLNLGYSHFYAEVIRVKNVAEQVGDGKNLVVIFDELYKGTNVKDAYDATVATVEEFSNNRNCLYIISTHIIEAGMTLKERCNNFKFLFFPTIMDGKIPTYTYKLSEGITGDRHGMMIIRNEKIIEIITNN